MIAFAVANRQIVTVSLDPFGGSDSGLSLPLFVLIILLVLLRLLVGGRPRAEGLRPSRARQSRCGDVERRRSSEGISRSDKSVSLIVKICGLSTPEALDAALNAGADMVGFVFFPPSPRNVSFETALALGARVKGRAKKVALSVDADDALLANIVDVLSPDFLQLHGKETPARVSAVKERFRLPVMKAIAVETRGDLGSVAAYAEVADRLLFDARAPREATRPGGLGKSFGWQLFQNFSRPVPF